LRPQEGDHADVAAGRGVLGLRFLRVDQGACAFVLIAALTFRCQNTDSLMTL
jgi:hypothetical protein